MASFGEELKRERELRDISLKEISEATKISIRFLEALEQNNFDILPGGIFNRGFVRSYARFIGIDGEEMVNAYLHELSVREARKAQAPGAGVSSPPAEAPAVFRPETRRAPRVEKRPEPSVFIPPETKSSSISWEARERVGGRTSVTLWVLAVLVLVAAVTFLTMSFRGDSPASASAGSHDQAVKARLARKATIPSAASVSPPTDTIAGQLPGGGTANPAAGSNEEATAAAASPEAPLSPNEIAAPPPPSHALVVAATEATGVVVQCAGQIVLNEMMWPGASRTFHCQEPISLSADNAGALEYSLDGAAPLPLGAVGEQILGQIVAPPPEPPKPERSAGRPGRDSDARD